MEAAITIPIKKNGVKKLKEYSGKVEGYICRSCGSTDITLTLYFQQRIGDNQESLNNFKFTCTHCEGNSISTHCPECEQIEPPVITDHYHGEEYCQKCGTIMASVIPLWSGDYKFRPVHGIRK